MKRIISTILVLLIAFSTILNPSYAKANKKPEIKPMTSEWEELVEAVKYDRTWGYKASMRVI